MTPARRALAVAAAALVPVATAVAPAEAASALQFRTFVADQPGADLPVSNTKLNREYIQVKNTGRTAITMTGYQVKDAENHTFVFPRGFVLKAGVTVTVHTGKGTNSATHLYWKQGNYVWNNTRDTARLLNRTGARLDVCTYTKRSSGVVAC